MYKQIKEQKYLQNHTIPAVRTASGRLLGCSLRNCGVPGAVPIVYAPLEHEYKEFNISMMTCKEYTISEGFRLSLLYFSS